ncbi:dihydropteroate synthase [Myxococcus stipitatus DSM 14675]|uniref:Dihydropteroate synthase n=1 Tax=Myxococcus stipitatus (strain DSM 14675 / JCM 12634 / Mx s8) TaxID=1278073 RepID=L7UE61_MYXSD|nr:dihydropteroate synthase [Myxococcus stipitatus]AGC46150.1 dihydropteroate synthase [Myxococcus stipitatus DSM 14675]
MIRARPISVDRPEDLTLALRRMGLPTPAREYLLEKVPHAQVLLTGVPREVSAFLHGLHERALVPGREEHPAWVSGDVRSRPGTGLLSGRLEQFERLMALARSQRDAALAALAEALARAMDAGKAPEPWVLGDRVFHWGSRTYVMGVVNVTPDSFSDGGRYLGADAAIARGLALVAAGADFLDVGGESTRPGSASVSAEEEVARVLPVIEGLRAKTSVPLSVDTTKAAVARAVLGAGAHLINDITGFRSDPELPRVVAEANAACCLMHIQGTPSTMQQAPRYEDLVDEVLDFLEGSVALATGAGIPRERILLDPGIGFGKTFDHNLYLLRRLGELRVPGLPLLVGTSRKGFLGALTGGKPAGERLAATLGSLAAMAVLGGADVVRVHDVAEARDALVVGDAIRTAMDGGALR